MTIDRKDNNKGYTKSNCRWATRKTQQRNLSRNVRVDYKGKPYCIGELAELSGLNPSTLHSRIFKYGWSVTIAVETPVGSRPPEKALSTPSRGSR